MLNQQCDICPRNCQIDRNKNLGFCNEEKEISISKIIEHFCWEEPCLAKKNGTLAIFFSGCNLKCDYCQNYQISRGGTGKKYSVDEFVELINKNQVNHSSIDLITPTHFSLPLSQAFEKIEKKVPVIWNTNSYETTTNIERVSKFVDIFLADLKYADDQLGKKFSCVNDYFSKALPAIKRMCALKDDIEKDRIMKQGVIIRHLVLPGYIKNSFKTLDVINQYFSTRKLSLMSQFVPNGKGLINRKLSKIEYKAVVSHMQRLGLQNGYLQEFSSANENFIPNFV